jgi:hypothetical protein
VKGFSKTGLAAGHQPDESRYHGVFKKIKNDASSKMLAGKAMI